MEDGPYGPLLGVGRFKLEQLLDRGQPVASAGGWVVTEGDPLQLPNVLGATGSRELLLGRAGLGRGRWLRLPRPS